MKKLLNNVIYFAVSLAILVAMAFYIYTRFLKEFNQESPEQIRAHYSFVGR